MLSESFAIDKLDADTFPLTYKIINKYQRKDSALMGKLNSALNESTTLSNIEYHSESFRGGGTVIDLICRQGKIVVP